MRKDGPSRNSPSPDAVCPEPDIIGGNATIGRLEAVLEEYTRRSISAPDVVKQIITILEAAPEFDDTQRSAARDRFIERMEEVALHRARTITRGGQDSGGAGPEHPIDPLGAGAGERVAAQAPRNAGRSGGDPAPGRIRRAREINDDAAGAPLKRLRNINGDHDARYGWNWHYPGGGPPWDNEDPLSNAEKTELLQNIYLSDIKAALRSLQGRRERPAFPDGLWKGILLNQYTDFRQIIDDHYAVMPAYSDAITLGDEAELTFSRAPPSRKKLVGSHGDWTIAWQKYQRAVRFAYPHRILELEKYHEHLVDKFGSIPVETRVISYDSAARKWLHEHGDLDFGDTHELLNIAFNHLGGSGGASTGESGVRRPKGGRGGGEEARPNLWAVQCNRRVHL